MTEKLKPCPFCRGKVKKNIAPIIGMVMFVCEKCGADVCFYGAEHEPKATEAWNRRAEKEPPLPVEYEADGYDDNGELIYDTAYCPNCRNEYEVYYDYHDNYCRKCGQKLDWRSDNG